VAGREGREEEGKGKRKGREREGKGEGGEGREERGGRKGRGKFPQIFDPDYVPVNL
jgi:hypothetical protein